MKVSQLSLTQRFWTQRFCIKKIVPGMQIELQPGHGPQHRPSAYMDNTRIREEVGYRPEYTIDRAITAYIDWLRRHPE
jgi:UDP-glucose 4-epimerase